MGQYKQNNMATAPVDKEVNLYILRSTKIEEKLPDVIFITTRRLSLFMGVYGVVPIVAPDDANRKDLIEEISSPDLLIFPPLEVIQPFLTGYEGFVKFSGSVTSEVLRALLLMMDHERSTIVQLIQQ